MIITQCYLCHKFKVGNRWEYLSDTQEHEISHGLCPVCMPLEEQRLAEVIESLEKILNKRGMINEINKKTS